jgi:hypothetical protein
MIISGVNAHARSNFPSVSAHKFINRSDLPARPNAFDLSSGRV